MRDLRLGWLWLMFGLLGVLGVIVVSLVPPSPTPDVVNLDKLLHLGVYALMVVWFGAIFLQHWHPFIAFVFILLGIGLEFAQAQTGYRSYELPDMLANALGSVLGVGLAGTVFGESLARLEHRLGLG